jgi:hypothetical protein
MQIDDPETLAEIGAVFHEYETALLENDEALLDAMFLHLNTTVRYGVAEVQYGIDEVRRFRARQQPFNRTLSRTVITTYGRDIAVASTLFHRPDFPDHVGRQTQTWVRMADGWKVAAAHVSMMDACLVQERA